MVIVSLILNNYLTDLRLLSIGYLGNLPIALTYDTSISFLVRRFLMEYDEKEKVEQAESIEEKLHKEKAQGVGASAESSSGFPCWEDDETFPQESVGHVVNFYNLIDGVANVFEQQHEIRVTSDARSTLITPALPYKEQVEDELKRGEITVSFLEESIFTVLQNAVSIAKAKGERYISSETVEESMKRYCPYLFWC